MVEMGQEFAASEYREKLDYSPEAVKELLGFLIVNSDALFLVAEKSAVLIGMMGVLAHPHPISGKRVAMEAFWWVDPEHRGSAGIRVLNAAKEWARDQKVTSLFMVAPSERIEKLYERLGLQRVEVHYQLKLEE